MIYNKELIYKLVEAKHNGGVDYLLLLDDKVISRWAEIDPTNFTRLEDWDNQAESGHDLSDYQADLDYGKYDQVKVIGFEKVFHPLW